LIQNQNTHGLTESGGVLKDSSSPGAPVQEEPRQQMRNITAV